MIKLVEVKKIEGIEYRLEGLQDIQVLRILKALESANQEIWLVELQEMIDTIKQDIQIINQSQIKGGIKEK